MIDEKYLKNVQIWTKEEQVKELIEKIETKDWTNYVFIDPCCGTGNIIEGVINNRPEVKKIIGIELDGEIIQQCKERFSIYDNVEIIEGSLFDIELDEDKYIIIMNPPYQYKNKSVYLDFIYHVETVFDPKYSSYIIPSKWLYGRYSSKESKFVEYLINKGISNIDFISGYEAFDQVHSGECMTFNIGHDNDNEFIDISGKKIFDDGYYGDIIKLISDKNDPKLLVENYFHGKRYQKTADTDKLLFKKNNSYFKDLRRYDGGPYNYEVVKEGKKYQSDMFSFNINGYSYKNIDIYMKSKLVNYLFSYVATSKNTSMWMFSEIPMPEFLKLEGFELDDDYIYEYYGMNDRLIEEVERTYKEFEPSLIHKLNKTKRKRLILSDLNIKNGEYLYFIKDNNIKVKVVNNKKNQVTDGVDVLSISKMAEKLMKVNRPLQGTIFFTYNDRRIDMLREE